MDNSTNREPKIMDPSYDLKLHKWYSQLTSVKLYLIGKDERLWNLFDTVDTSGFQLHTIIKIFTFR